MCQFASGAVTNRHTTLLREVGRRREQAYDTVLREEVIRQVFTYVLGFVLTDTYLHVPDFSECQRKACVERWWDGGDGRERERVREKGD